MSSSPNSSTSNAGLFQPWEVQLFGGPTARQGEVLVTRFRSQNIAALFAYLCLFKNRRHTREELADLLWPDEMVEVGRANLRTALASLRRQLEPPGSPVGAVFVAEGQNYLQIRPEGVQTDVAAFEAAIAAGDDAGAVALYRGPLIPGMYFDWAITERERLTGIYRGTLDRLTLAMEQAGNRESALDYARRAVAEDPGNEAMHRTIMRLLAAHGDRAAALIHFKDLTRLLRDRLDMEPSEETRTLREQIERGAIPVTPIAPPPTPLPEAAVEIPNPPPPAPAVPAAPGAIKARVQLPASLNRFFGREAEMTIIREVLGERASRLVTLTGSGGSGKTRLAVETARMLTEAFPGGVFFVPLLDIQESDRLTDALLDAMRLPRSRATTPRDTVLTSLNTADGPVLLVVDNAEHLVDATAALLTDLLNHSQTLSCLVTSRQRLLLEGEREVALSPLPVPALPGTPERLMEFPSVQLFVSRCQAGRPDFQLSPRNADAVVALCIRLEGIPLALELAAGWAQTLAPTQMLERLNKRFDLLISRRRNISPRHATLRAAIESSYQMLPKEVQQCFNRLSVFQGGWTTDAAEAITEDPFALESLALLRDHSLVVTDTGPNEEMRFRMLETLREFAAEQLSEEETATLARRHAEYFTNFAVEIAPQLKQADQTLHRDRLEADHSNLRAAIAWCGRTEGTEDTGLRLAYSLMRFYSSRGYLREGVAATQEMLAHNPERQDPTHRANALNALGVLARHLSEYELARNAMLASMEIWRQLNDMRGVANALANLGTLTLTEGDFTAAIPYSQEALGIFLQMGREHSAAICLNNLGLAARELGDLEAARAYHDDSLQRMRALQDLVGIAINIFNLGYIARASGDFALAQMYYSEALQLNIELNDPEGIAGCLRSIAFLWGKMGREDEAVVVLGAAAAQQEGHGLPILPLERIEYDATVTRFRESLGEKTFHAAWEKGQEMLLGQVLHLVGSAASSSPAFC